MSFLPRMSFLRKQESRKQKSEVGNVVAKLASLNKVIWRQGNKVTR